VTIALWFLAVLAYVIGRRITRALPQPTTRLRRIGALALWFASGAATLAALVSALNQM
jgi:hypothetical protein